MIEPNNVIPEEVVTPPGVEPASPAEPTPQEPEGAEPGTPQEPVTPQEPEQQVPYERFKTVNDERKALLELLQRQTPKLPFEK